MVFKMKKIRIAVITLIVLLIGTGAFLWKMNDISKNLEKQEKALLAEERDLVEEQKQKAIDEVTSVHVIPLRMDGEDKNVMTTSFSGIKEIYSVKKSSEIEENVTTIKENRSFTLENALWAYNLYGTNRNSMYVYFTTGGNCYLRYTISVKDEKIPDFTRTAYTSNAKNVTKEHEYQLIGLVPGKTNYITMRLYNAEDELSEVKYFSFDVPKSESNAEVILDSEKGKSSKTDISNGLYVVFEERKEDAILLYDNSGVLRSEIPTNRFIGRNLESVYDTLLYAVSKNQLVQVNYLGQVMKVLTTSGYEMSNAFTYDGYGNVFAIATALGKKETPDSKVIKVSLEGGTVKEMADMDTLLSKIYQKAQKKAGKKQADWIGLNSIQVTGTNEFLISSKKLSSVFKVKNAGSLLPKIEYIIADKKIYASYKNLRKKVLTKAVDEEEQETEETAAVNNILHKKVTPEPFPSQYGQENLQYVKRSAEGVYDLSMVSANAGLGSKGGENGYFYTYRIDELTKTYRLVQKQAVEKTKKDGNYIRMENQYIYCCSDGKVFSETDSTGRLIKKFTTKARPYRVYKNDFKKFWFR